MSSDLLELFEKFCYFGAGKDNVAGMDSAKFVKFCRDTNLFDKNFTPGDADVIHTASRGLGERRIPFTIFKDVALKLVAEKKGCTRKELIAKVLECEGPLCTGTKADTVKLHDDKSLHTGVHGWKVMQLSIAEPKEEVHSPTHRKTLSALLKQTLRTEDGKTGLQLNLEKRRRRKKQPKVNDSSSSGEEDCVAAAPTRKTLIVPTLEIAHKLNALSEGDGYCDGFPIEVEGLGLYVDIMAGKEGSMVKNAPLSPESANSSWSSLLDASKRSCSAPSSPNTSFSKPPRLSQRSVTPLNGLSMGQAPSHPAPLFPLSRRPSDIMVPHSPGSREHSWSGTPMSTSNTVPLRPRTSMSHKPTLALPLDSPTSGPTPSGVIPSPPISLGADSDAGSLTPDGPRSMSPAGDPLPASPTAGGLRANSSSQSLTTGLDSPVDSPTAPVPRHFHSKAVLCATRIAHPIPKLPRIDPVTHEFVTSNFKAAYDAAKAPNSTLELLVVLRTLIAKYADLRGIDQRKATLFFEDLKETAVKELQSEVHCAAARIWTSPKTLEKKEICYIINEILREDNAQLMPLVATFTRAINLLLVSLSRLSMAPTSHLVYRGGGIPEEHQTYFMPGHKYRVPMFTATSLDRDQCVKTFCRRAQMHHGLPPVLWIIALDELEGCKHVNFIHTTECAEEQEYLFSPYSVFTVEATEWKTSATWRDPHVVYLRAAADNRLEPETLPLAPWA